MTEIYLQGTDVYSLAIKLKLGQPIVGQTRKLLVKCNITPSEYEAVTISRTLLLVQDSEDVSAYLLRKNNQHQLYQIDTEFCERLLLRLVSLLRDNLSLEDLKQSSLLCLSGQANVQEFQDIEHADKESAQIHDSNQQPSS